MMPNPHMPLFQGDQKWSSLTNRWKDRNIMSTMNLFVHYSFKEWLVPAYLQSDCSASRSASTASLKLPCPLSDENTASFLGILLWGQEQFPEAPRLHRIALCRQSIHSDVSFDEPGSMISCTRRCEDILHFAVKGQKRFQEFIVNRLLPTSTQSVWDSNKEAQAEELLQLAG